MMSCDKCGDTGWSVQYECETGFVDIPCPECHGVDGEQPDHVTEGHDALTQEDIEGVARILAYAAFRRIGQIAYEQEQVWAEHDQHEEEEQP